MMTSHKPVCLDKPTGKEIELTKLLNKYIDQLQHYETVEELKVREKIVGNLMEIFIQWIKGVARDKDICIPDSAERCWLHLLTHGGQHIHVVSKGSDTDLVAIVPAFVTHKEFFGSLKCLLQKNENVSDIRAVEGAYVPVLKFKYCEIQIDVCMCVLMTETVPSYSELLKREYDIHNLDPSSLRSLNGLKGGEELLRLVPNQEIYCHVLKCIKVWAKSQFIYSSALGYLGGAAWAILVAHVCQLYPNAGAAVLVSKFFKVYMDWNWPKPVLLQPLSKDTHGLKPWNPKVTVYDAHHIMPVITSVYPEHNTTFTITRSSLRIIQTKWATAAAKCDGILRGEYEWSELLSNDKNFFTNYRHFLMVTAVASTVDDLRDWSGLVEAKLRIFVLSLEKQAAVDLIQIFTKPYSSSQTENICGKHFMRWFLGIQLTRSEGVHLDLALDVETFDKMLYEMACTRNIYQKGMTIEITHVKRKQLRELVPSEDIKV